MDERISEEESQEQRRYTWPGSDEVIRRASPWQFARTDEETRREDERDTHFANWAASVWDELHTLSTRKIDEADKERYEAMDKEILARAGYDLVRYAIDAIKPHIYTNTFTPDTQDEIFKSIPDMTAQSEQEDVHTEEG